MAETNSSNNGKRRNGMHPLGEVFHGSFYEIGPDRQVEWLILCRYCGYEAVGEALEHAASDFFEHMFFGVDTSREHFEYVAGKRKKVRLTRAQQSGQQSGGII